MLEDRGVESISGSASEVHVDDIEDEQRHEKMLQVMDRFVQGPHEGGSQNRIGAPAHDERHAVLRKRYVDIQIEIHPDRIAEDTPETDRKEFPDFPFLAPQPKERDEDSDIDSG